MCYYCARIFNDEENEEEEAEGGEEEDLIIFGVDLKTEFVTGIDL